MLFLFISLYLSFEIHVLCLNESCRQLPLLTLSKCIYIAIIISFFSYFSSIMYLVFFLRYGPKKNLSVLISQAIEKKLYQNLSVPKEKHIHFCVLDFWIFVLSNSIFSNGNYFIGSTCLQDCIFFIWTICVPVKNM